MIARRSFLRRRRIGPRARPRRGFTLVELILAIILLSLGMLATATMLVSSMRLQRLSGSRGELTALAEAKLEELRGYGQTLATDPLRANLALGGSLTANVASYADSVTGMNNVVYYRRWLITNGIAGARQVQLRVVPRTQQEYHASRIDITSTVLLQ